jgi:hypothetical protein
VCDHGYREEQAMNRCMKYVAVVCLGLSTVARADWDPELEKREEAQREVERQQEARRQAEVEVMRTGAMRQALGADARGKSDAEVRRLYQQRFENPQAQLKAAQAQQAKAKQDIDRSIAPHRAQIDAATQAMYGKSLDELQNMSEAEAEAMAKELEARYGQ